MNNPPVFDVQLPAHIVAFLLQIKLVLNIFANGVFRV